MHEQIKDPFVRSPSIEVDGTLMELAVQAILTRIGATNKVPFISKPITLQCNVLGSTSDGVCRQCGKSMWLSPSSKLTLLERKDELVCLCLICVDDEISKLTENEA